jgi:hypothetical protein
MNVAAAELRAGFVETEETRSWDTGHSPEMQAAQ